MAEDNPFGFSDDLVDTSNVKIKVEQTHSEPTIEDWVYRQNRNALTNWIKQENREKIQKYLSYDWNNPSERVLRYTKLLLSNDNPLLAICTHGDPSKGEFLRVLLKYKDKFDEDQQPYITVASIYNKLSPEELRLFLTHPNAIDPFTPNPAGANYNYRARESPIEIAIRHNRLEFFKEMLQYSKSPRMDKVLKYACRHSFDIVKYLIEERCMSVNQIICGKVPLQHAFSYWRDSQSTADYILSHGADINGKDKNGNPVLLYAAHYNYHNIDKLINSESIVATTNKLKADHEYFPDGMTVFGIAARNQASTLKKLFEFKAKMPFDPEFEQMVIADVLTAENYTSLATMWQFINKRDIASALLKERTYLIDGKEEKLLPVEKMCVAFESLQKRFLEEGRNKWDLYRSDSDLRAIWRHLVKNTSPEEMKLLLNTPTKNGERLANLVASCNLLPEDYRVSNQIWKSTTEYNLGIISNLPIEIARLIFGNLSFSDTCQVASVSKSWFKEITAKNLWHEHPEAAPGSSNPFRSIQKYRVNGHLRKRERFRQVVQLEDGEGLLVVEYGFLTGIKLNGEPIMSTWPQFCGSVYRCISRVQSLSRESIETAVKQIENMLNSGHIEFENLVDTLMPFMKCLTPGFYDVEAQMRGDYKLFEYSSDTNFSDLETEFPFYPLVYFTQPSDLLNEERVKYYEDQILRGLRPAALAIESGVELFIIDGHHKITAYKNLDLIKELVVVSVGSHDRDDSSKIPLDEEMKYISHSKTLLNRYKQAKKSMRIGTEDD